MTMSDSATLAPREETPSAFRPDAVDSDNRIDRYRAWVTDYPVKAAVLAGFVATHIATVIGYWLPGIGLPQLDWHRVNGSIFTPNASSTVQFVSGGYFHYLDGIAFTVVFAVAVFPMLKWASTPLGNTLKGLLFGTILATVSCAFMIPRVYFPHAHAGFFSHHLGWKLILAVYVWHWVYGLHLGLLYNPLARSARSASRGR
jgi:hypothetical protein